MNKKIYEEYIKYYVPRNEIGAMFCGGRGCLACDAGKVCGEELFRRNSDIPTETKIRKADADYIRKHHPEYGI